MLEKNTIFRLFEESKEKFDINIILREKFKEAKKLIDYKEILAITGVRRSGKTYFMYELMQYLTQKVPKENIVYLNFEDERLAFLQRDELDKIFEYYYEFSGAKGKLYFFFDEIQNVPYWEKWLSRSFEKHKFVISGSNSKLLSSELVSAITGRYFEIRIFPFTYKETLERKYSLYKTENVGLLKRKFSEYLEYGGFPESILYGKKDLLQEYYKSIILKDVINRHNIKYKDLIKRLSLFVASNYSKPLSLYSLNKQYDAGINTIKNYVNYLEESFLYIFIDKFDYSLKKQQYNPPKAYGVDVAIMDAINFKFSKDIGRKIENIVLIELLNRKCEVFYHKDKYECDFVVKEGLDIVQAIQVCYELNDENSQREIKGLKSAMKKYNLKEGLLITYDTEKEIENIKVKPVWKFLLEKI
ncbi:MAG: ATP-binding protein [Nanoarchaeota archaeon]